jgi:branched-chain amino acid aminotransferase
VLDIKTHYAGSPKALPFTDPNAELGFGKIFTDHMFVSRYVEGHGWSRSEIIPYGPLEMDPAASVLHYGQALFEGMKAFRRDDGSIWLFRPEYNCRRMADGADRLCLPQPSRAIFMQGLKALLQLEQRWVPPALGSSLYIRPTLIGTEAFLGVRPAAEALFFIILSPVGSYYAEGVKPVKIWLETSDVRASVGGLGAVKAGANYAASLRASVRAKAKGCSQVLWLDTQHEGIEEVGTMNVFFVFKDEIVTPALNGSILAGGMRDSVLQILRSHKNFSRIRISERRLTITEVRERHAKGELQEVFGTGTAAVISPVGEIKSEEQSLVIAEDIGSVSSWLLNTIQGMQWGTVKDDFGWMCRLEDLA